MDKISELLQYVRRTNPEMTREKLIEELGKSDYVARSINFTKENFSACQESNRERCTKHVKKGGFTPPVFQFLE